MANEADQNTGELWHRKGRRSGLERSIRPGVRVPVTLLVAEMRDGALFLQGWRDGPTAYVIADDAGPLRQALAAAFGSTTDESATADEVLP